MTDKVTLTDLGSIQNDPSATGIINANNAAIKTAIDGTLSRQYDGVNDNFMISPLDMGGLPIINVGPPVANDSVVRVKDVVNNPTLTIPTTGEFGHTVPFLDGNNVWSGTNEFSGNITVDTGATVDMSAATAVRAPTMTNTENSTKVATTAFVQNVATLGSISGLSVLGVTGAASATPAAITGTANQILGVNNAGTSLVFESVSGDATMQGGAVTLATVNTDVGSYGSSTAVPTITANAKGLVTAVTTNSVVAPAGTLTGTTLASNVVTSSLTSVSNTVELGADAAAPTAANIVAPSVTAGTTNTPGVDLTIKGSIGTGTGVGGSVKIQTTPAGTSGSTQNSLVTRVSVDGTGSVVVGGSALATTATDGFLYIPTCAGVPTGTPTTHSATIPIIYDTTDNKIYVYNGGWKATVALT